MRDTTVQFANITFKNPVTTASGTFGSGREFAEFFDLSRLGAVTVKGVSATAWEGNPPGRIAETYGGMLNAIGLQNPGVAYFIQNDIPFLRQFDTKIIVNICGHTVEEYAEVTQKLQGADIDMLELNISCPNVSEGGIAFGTDVTMLQRVIREVKKRADKPLVVKLSPNVTDIVEMAKAAEAAGADGLSLINTLLGMRIDIKKRQSVLQRKYGGLSGPAIMPVALRMVHLVAQHVKIPIIGMGGIATAEDAIAFIMAGATMVAVGTASFQNPRAAAEICDGIEAFMEEENISCLSEIRGIIK